jgi:hypothetical protein
LADAESDQAIQHQAMLTSIYVEALSADSALADQVWDQWDAGAITDEAVAWAWWRVANF